MTSANFRGRFLTGILIVLAVAGCKTSGDDATAAVQSIDGIPTIWGDPAKTAIVNTPYSFMPEVADSDGDILEFIVANKPAWTTFDSNTGELRGTPGNGDVGADARIIISVTDGSSIISLASFTLNVALTVPADGEADTSVAASQPPIISGKPNATAVVDNMYAFQPDASDPDGDDLSFSIIRKPSWATFDTTTGRVEGRPGGGDLGVSERIRLTATDGMNEVGLNQFAIAVEAVGATSFSLSWAAPTENEDGSPLTNLAGYRVYYGTTPGNYSEAVELDSTGITSYVIENLAPGDYYLVMTSVNSDNLESGYTPEISFGLGS